MAKWLLTVGTNCADPAHEKEFNAWYDSVNVPAHLQVTGFKRATRYECLRTADPRYSLVEGDPKYLALYEIETENIDATIREMNELDNLVEERGRITPFLVVQRVATYRQIAPAYEKPLAARIAEGGEAEQPKWLFVVQGICVDPQQEREFNHWYDNMHIADIMEARGFVRATRYELELVLCDDKPGSEQARFLAVYEIEAVDVEDTMAHMRTIGKRLRGGGRMSPLFEHGPTRFYRQLMPPRTK